MRACFCPSCGASLNLDDENRDFGFCQYCGTKIMLDDFRVTHRVVDEARIREDETNRIIRMREMEMEERERDQRRDEMAVRERQIEMENLRKNRLQLTKTLVTVFVALILILIGFVTFQDSGENNDMFGLLFIELGVLIVIICSVSEVSKREE